MSGFYLNVLYILTPILVLLLRSHTLTQTHTHARKQTPNHTNIYSLIFALTHTA